MKYLLLLFIFLSCTKQPEFTDYEAKATGLWQGDVSPFWVYSFSEGCLVQRVIDFDIEITRLEYSVRVKQDTFFLTNLFDDENERVLILQKATDEQLIFQEKREQISPVFRLNKL